MIQIATILCVLAVYAHGSAIPIPVPRFRLGGEKIVGGYPIDIKDAPYQISFQRLNRHMCGGSIISEFHVLTAAHCSVVESNVRNLVVGSGNAKQTDLKKHLVDKNVSHKLFSRASLDYDVAVLKVDKRFDFSDTQKPIALISSGQDGPVNEAVVVSGWGSTVQGGGAVKQLMQVELSLVARPTCKSAYTAFLPVTSRMVCAGVPPGGKDSCQGDSGGPLVIKKTNTQVGIVSWGYGCGKPSYPGVYTNVGDPEVHAFITANLQNL